MSTNNIGYTFLDDSSNNFYSDNTQSNFRVKLAHPFDFRNSQYECGLAEIHLPKKIVNIRKGYNKIVLYRIFKASLNLDTPKQIILLPSKFYNADEVVEIIKNKVRKVVVKTINGKPKEFKAITVHYNSKTKKVTIVTKFGYAIHLDTDICTLLGFKPNVGIRNYSNHYLIKGTRVGEYQIVKQIPTKTIFVYTSLIKDQYFESKQAPLLKVIHVNNNTNNKDSEGHRFNPIDFCPLNKSHFESIDIKLFGDNNKPVFFKEGKVLMVLMFQKV